MYVPSILPSQEHYLPPATVRTMPAVIGYGAGLALVLGAFDYTNGSLMGWVLGPKEDIVARKALLRSTFRLPMEETIAEIGEGRGMPFFFFFL